jgi:hypothetical protein
MLLPGGDTLALTKIAFLGAGLVGKTLTARASRTVAGEALICRVLGPPGMRVRGHNEDARETVSHVAQHLHGFLKRRIGARFHHLQS